MGLYVGSTVINTADIEMERAIALAPITTQKIRKGDMGRTCRVGVSVPLEDVGGQNAAGPGR